MAQKPTVKVSRDTWRRLTERKEPGVSYDEIITGLLDDVDSSEDDRNGDTGSAAEQADA